MRTARYFSMLLAVAALGSVPAAGAAPQDDQNRARTIQRAQRDQERFRSMDVNQDGVISRREWRGTTRQFRELDTDGNHELAGREVWFRLPSDTSRYSEEDQRREDMIATFYSADRNRDGRLVWGEWWDDRSAFDRSDANRDRVLTLFEFLYSDAAIDVPVATTGETRTESPAHEAGYQRGLVDGRVAGREDRALRNRWDLEGQSELVNADAGYRNELGRRDEYQAGYRAGFRRGYEQGFGKR